MQTLLQIHFVFQHILKTTIKKWHGLFCAFFEIVTWQVKPFSVGTLILPSPDSLLTNTSITIKEYTARLHVN